MCFRRFWTNDLFVQFFFIKFQKYLEQMMMFLSKSSFVLKFFFQNIFSIAFQKLLNQNVFQGILQFRLKFFSQDYPPT